MSKGAAVANFKVGQRIIFKTDIGEKVFTKEKDEKGKIFSKFSHKVNIVLENAGRIVKLHKSGRQGVAEICPESPVHNTGMKKISRKLQHCEKA